MRTIACLRAVVATLICGSFALLIPLMASDSAIAQGNAKRPAETSPAVSNARKLSLNDRVAAMERVQFALSEVGDGASYVWRRSHGKLSGVIQPTQSFLDSKGRVCRHIIVLFSSGTKAKKTEAVACRLDNGVWRFDS
jgi:surface antigen